MSTVFIGDRDSFAIESSITSFVASDSQMALGHFVIYVRGKCFGLKAADASMLGCSLNEVAGRLKGRGTHCLQQLADFDAPTIAAAYVEAIYCDTERSNYLGFSKSGFVDAIYKSRIVWAPDGDEAFDDGSHVLQVDTTKMVRLIAFKNVPDLARFGDTVEEHWIDPNRFYEVLSRWKGIFTDERSESLDGATIDT